MLCLNYWIDLGFQLCLKSPNSGFLLVANFAAPSSAQTHLTPDQAPRIPKNLGIFLSGKRAWIEFILRDTDKHKIFYRDDIIKDFGNIQPTEKRKLQGTLDSDF